MTLPLWPDLDPDLCLTAPLWAWRSCSTQVMLHTWSLYNPDRLYGERYPAKSLEVHPADGPILDILTLTDEVLTKSWPWPDPWPKNWHFKCSLEAAFRKLSFAALPVSLQPLVLDLSVGGISPPPPSSPPPASGGWRNTPATAGLSNALLMTFSSVHGKRKARHLA